MRVVGHRAACVEIKQKDRIGKAWPQARRIAANR
jgi:hypothetical protein